jgi:sulfur transfer complex TusBCD TusB component (DsrH family)
MRRCFIITAYCETEEKLISLRDTLERVKKYDYGVLLYSHYPVDAEIQKMCDYVVFDYSNPIFSYADGRRAIINWTKLPIPFKLLSLIDDYGYAVIQQVKRGLLKMIDLGYDMSIILNYDAKFTEDFLFDVETTLETYDALFLDFSDGELPAYFLPFFGINHNKYLSEINEISKQHYLDNSTDLMAEGYMANLIKDNIKVIPRSEWDGLSIAWSDIIFIDDFFKRDNDKCHFFIGRDDNNNKLSFLCYAIVEDFEISFKYNDEVIYFSKVKKNDEYFYSQLPIIFSEIDSSKLNIYINDVEIYLDYKYSVKYSTIEKT